jgi:hypothetical protein
MQTEHAKNCNCYDCGTIQTMNHADKGYGEDDSKLSYYLNSHLVATKPLNIWTRPGASIGGKIKETIPVGGNVGYIYSWVRDKKTPKGSWIILSSVSGSNPKIIGYIPIQYLSKIDKGIATESSSGKKFTEEMKAADATNLSVPTPVIDFMGKAKWYIIGMLFIILVAVFLRIKG